MGGGRPIITVVSLWRNDAGRGLRERARHLLVKESSTHDVEFLWGVGDSVDGTRSQLLKIHANHHATRQLTIVNVDTDIVGEDVHSRRIRLSAAATTLFSLIPPHSDFTVLHESDLRSSRNILGLLAPFKGWPTAAWPTINLTGDPQFYDIWAYRHLDDGRNFTPNERRPNHHFEVSSFGSVWVAPSNLVRGRVMKHHAVVELCSQWRDEGVKLYCDPSVEVIQPVDLWSPC